MPIDIYVISVVLVLWIAFLIMGIQKVYESFFGLVIGLAIYLMLTVLLSPTYQTPETAKIISPLIAKFLIGSSTYLIFILFILTPISWGIPFPETKVKFFKFLEHAAVAAFIWVFFFALVLGFASKTYIFNVDTAFGMIKNFWFYPQLLQGVIFSKISMYLQPIVLFGVLFLIFKMLFSDVIGVILGSIWKWLLSLKKRGQKEDGGHDDHGGWHDDHGGHDDHMDDEVEHDDHGGWHDDHGGGHH